MEDANTTQILNITSGENDLDDDYEHEYLGIEIVGCPGNKEVSIKLEGCKVTYYDKLFSKPLKTDIVYLSYITDIESLEQIRDFLNYALPKK